MAMMMLRRRLLAGMGGEWRSGLGVASRDWSFGDGFMPVGGIERDFTSLSSSSGTSGGQMRHGEVGGVTNRVTSSSSTLTAQNPFDMMMMMMMRGGQRCMSTMTDLKPSSSSSSSIGAEQQAAMVSSMMESAAEHASSRVPVYDLNKQPVSGADGAPAHIDLPDDVFAEPVRVDILHRVVRWQLAKRQQGTHVTKTRSDVRGGGRKPWQQKGSGRARQGTIRAPQWRGGGVVHGPVLRSHAHSLQKRVRRLGLKCAVSAKIAEGRFLVVDALQPEDAKTATMKGHVGKLLEGAPRESVLFVDTTPVDELRLGIRNIPWVDVLPVGGMNVYSILQRDFLILTKDAVDEFINRMRRPIRPCSRTP
ncbi:hypothetical protein M9435_000987 [Picochlorum sp. BPE23]|nr:hypothetical protein M9435_000987 [Picochlorum sp. BPE23]